MREYACLPPALSILRLYALTPADLYFKWEAFLLSSSNSSLAFNLDNLRELKKDIQLSASTSNGAQHSTPGLASSVNGSVSGAAASNNSRIKKLAGRAALDGMWVDTCEYT